MQFRDSQLRDHDKMIAVNREFLSISEEFRKIVINFSGVVFVSSVALGTLVAINDVVDRAGGELHVCCLESPLDEVFKAARFGELFKIYADEASALKGF